jgi:hypothetical protein
MSVDVKIITVAILLCIVTAGIVLFGPVQSTKIEAIAESASAIITAASIIILVRHNREAAKQNTEATIRSEWAILHAERQRLESDVTECRIAASSEVRGAREGQLKERINKVSEYMDKMLKDYPDVFPNLALFTRQDKPNKEQQATNTDT